MIDPAYLAQLRRDEAPGDRCGGVLQRREHLHRLFESWIRACPGSWFASKRMWPKETYSADGPTAA